MRNTPLLTLLALLLVAGALTGCSGDSRRANTGFYGATGAGINLR